LRENFCDVLSYPRNTCGLAKRGLNARKLNYAVLDCPFTVCTWDRNAKCLILKNDFIKAWRVKQSTFFVNMCSYVPRHKSDVLKTLTLW